MATTLHLRRIERHPAFRAENRLYLLRVLLKHAQAALEPPFQSIANIERKGRRRRAGDR